MGIERNKQNAIPNELISAGWLQIKAYQTLWKMEPQVALTVHVKNNLMRRFGVAHSYAMDLSSCVGSSLYQNM